MSKLTSGIPVPLTANSDHDSQCVSLDPCWDKASLVVLAFRYVDARFSTSAWGVGLLFSLRTGPGRFLPTCCALLAAVKHAHASKHSFVKPRIVKSLEECRKRDRNDESRTEISPRYKWGIPSLFTRNRDTMLASCGKGQDSFENFLM